MTHLNDIVNKAKLFDNSYGKAKSTSKAKIINVLVNYAAKMERILDEMRVLFTSLELISAPQPALLDKVPNISIKTEALPLLN